MSDKVTKSVRLDPDTVAGLIELAEATERTVAFLMNRAIKEYVDRELPVVRRTLEAMAQADNGQVFTSEEAEQWLEQRRVSREAEHEDSLDPKRTV